MEVRTVGHAHALGIHGPFPVGSPANRKELRQWIRELPRSERRQIFGRWRFKGLMKVVAA